MNINDLLIEYDEMGMSPTTVCENPEQFAIDWRERVREEFERLVAENIALKANSDNEHQIAQGTKLYIIKDGKILEREIADIVFALAQKEAEEGDLFCEYIGFNTMLNNFNKTVFINKNTAVKKLRNKKGDKI